MISLPFDLKASQKQFYILVGVAALIVLILDFTLFLRPLFGSIFSSVSVINKTRMDLRNAEEIIAKIGSFKKDIASYEEKITYYEKRLPVEQEIPSLLENLSSIARNSNIKILGITPAPIREDTSRDVRIYQEIPILISAKCGYHELGRFISNLENSNRFMKVVDIAIRSNRATPKKHDVELLVLTYILLKGK